MSITLQRATPASLDEVTEAVATWQQDGGPVQLHPGDLGWHWRLGAEELAGAVRVWRRHGQILAVGVVDDSGLIRMAIAPSADRDDAFADQLLADLSEPGRRGELPADTGSSRPGSALPSGVACARAVGLPMSRGPRCVATSPSTSRTAVSGSRSSTRTTCRHGSRCSGRRSPTRRSLWSAGTRWPQRRPTHRDHRGHGHCTAISVAAAAALREMGASSATVCTPSSNVGAVATYASAGFRQLPDVTDFRRMSPPRPLIG